MNKVMDNNISESYGPKDKNSYEEGKFDKVFQNQYILNAKNKVTEKNITCSGLVSDNDEHIVSVFCNKKVGIINKETLKSTSTYQSHEEEVTCIKLCSDLILTSSLDGTIKIFDLRTNSIEKEWNSSNSSVKKPITSFDISINQNLVCGGTELIGEDSFILFWDIRSKALSGGYWESHSDDISVIKFNPCKEHYLATAGLDGLINIFDISKTSEEEALTYCLNTNDTVNSFCWNKKNLSELLCYTDVYSIQFWNIEDSKPKNYFSRADITKAMLRTEVSECYPVSLSYDYNDNIIVLAASGLEHVDNVCWRTLKVNEKKGFLEPHGLPTPNYDENASSSIQAAIFDKRSSDIIMIHEDGIFSMWKLKDLNF